MDTLPVKLSREQSRSEEIANTLSHGAGFVAALVGVPILIVHAARHGDAAFIVGTSIFSAAIFLLYGSSTIYHALPAGKAKRVFRVLEHSMIYLLIAGTYTPFTLGVLGGASQCFGMQLNGALQPTVTNTAYEPLRKINRAPAQAFAPRWASTL